MEAKPGDKVEVKTKDKVMHGTCMPEHDNTFVLKLESGYNVGIDKKNIVSIKVIETKKEKTSAKESDGKVAEQKSLPKISILHTGGTIASKVDYETGGVIARFNPEELTAMFPEIRTIANINSRLIRNMFSDDMRFAHYNILAKEVEKEAEAGSKGVIITHGTDTMHYSSAALAFALENLSIPVILVGAQRSSDRPSSDAAYNVISAAYFIAHSKWHGVGICMHESEADDWCSILPGLKARKMHTSRRDAFKPINTHAIARINFKQKKIEEKTKAADMKGNLAIRTFKESLKIGMIKAHPNMFSDEILALKNCDGLILEGTGLGHFSITKIDEHTDENEKILLALKEVAKKMPVAIAQQTIFGRINMNVYANGRKMIEAGVLGNMCDMTPETAFIKLAWLISNHPKEVKQLYGKNLRGEISERTENEFDTY